MGINLFGPKANVASKKKTFLILLLSDKKLKPSELLPFFSLVSFKLILSKIYQLRFSGQGFNCIGLNTRNIWRSRRARSYKKK